MTSENPSEVGLEDFERNDIARRFLRAINAHPEARDRVFNLLNDHANEQLLVHESESQRPAFQGIVHAFEGDPDILSVLETGEEGYRFRQAVGIAVWLKMPMLRWHSTGISRPLKRTLYFKSSKLYIPAPDRGGVR